MLETIRGIRARAPRGSRRELRAPSPARGVVCGPGGIGTGAPALGRAGRLVGPLGRPIATTWARFWTGRWITIYRLPSNSRQHSSTRGLCAGSSTRSCHASNGRSLIPTRSNPQCGRRRSAPTGTRSHSAARTMRWRNGYSTRALHSTADSGWRVKGRSCCFGSASSPGLGGTWIGEGPARGGAGDLPSDWRPPRDRAGPASPWRGVGRRRGARIRRGNARGGGGNRSRAR